MKIDDGDHAWGMCQLLSIAGHIRFGDLDELAAMLDCYIYACEEGRIGLRKSMMRKMLLKANPGAFSWLGGTKQRVDGKTRQQRQQSGKELIWEN
jgi:hypothetical protein